MRIRLLAVLFAFMVCSAQAQDIRGMISGTVTDPQGAQVAGATVVVTNTDTNVSTSLITNASGFYEAPLLLAGPYQVTVESRGFKKMVRSNLTLLMSDQLKIDIQLEVGAVNESITITAESPILDTSTVTLGKALTTREIMDLPIMTNDIVLLARVAPGVVNQGTTQYLTQGQVGGSSGFFAPLNLGQNEWSIDGAPNLGSAGIAFTPFTDQIAEYKIDTTSFDASVGHSIGLNIAFSTKSGTNSLHGSGTEQYWNTRWNAASFFVKQAYFKGIDAANAAGNTALANQLASLPMQPGGHANDYGFTLGGPVYIPKLLNGKNKLFWFFSYSGNKTRQPARSSEITNSVPTMAERQGDFSDLLAINSKYQIYDPLSVAPDPSRPGHYIRTPIPGNTIPQSRVLDPKVFNWYTSRLPAPNNNPTNPLTEPFNNFLALGQVDNVNYTGLASREDWAPGMKNRFSFSWNWSHFIENAQDWTYATEPGMQDWDNIRTARGGILSWTYSKSSATVISASASANQWLNVQETYGERKYKPSDIGFPTYLDQRCEALGGCAVPLVTWNGYTSAYGGSSLVMGRTLSPDVRQRSLGLKASVSHVVGGHSFQGGIDFRQAYATSTGGAGNSMGSFTFNSQYVQKNDDSFTPAGSLGLSYAAFMLGIPSSMSSDNNASYALMNPYYGWYGQDTWRVTRNLTVTLGLRVEYEQAPTERYNRAITYFDPAAQLPIAAGAQAAYAANPVPELAASGFTVQGGSVYAGVNGAPRQPWQNELMWLPRLSAAWQFNSKTIIRGGYGIYYDSINVQNLTLSQSGFSRTTSTNLTNDYGVNWLAGNPGAGISPLADPFPVRSDGTRFDAPLGNSLGAMYIAGQGFSYSPFDRKHPREQQWRIGVQRQLSPNMSVEAFYWGEWGDHLAVSDKLDALPAQYWNTTMVRNNAFASNMTQNVTNPFNINNFASLKSSNPALYQQMSTLGFFTGATIQKNQLLRAYPQITSLTTSQYYGKAKNNSLQVIFQRRLSHGFNVAANYTYSSASTYTTIINEFDPTPRQWTPTNQPVPNRVNVTGIYEFPFGPGRAFLRSGILSRIVGSWQVALTYDFQQGPFLTWGNDFYYGDLSTVSQVLTQGTKTLNQWFNTSAPFERNSANGPASYQARVFPVDITSVRADGLNQWNANLRRDFRLREGMTFEVRMDALNLLNRSQFAAPDNNPFDTTFGVVSSTTSTLNRFFQLQGRIRF
ncbi:MAG TPA: carboxypeptidase-like regulatory domain-containing protein [Bryobacteraceae bacterium]|nr:carboxypeptidase-like regulatory domain-containing protein [Bryobacteraceae bacterium]